jgi:hypothetical protein
MRRPSWRSIQFSVWLVSIGLQLALILWQWNFCAIADDKKSFVSLDLTRPSSQHERPSSHGRPTSIPSTPGALRKHSGDRIASLLPQLPFSPNYIRKFSRLNGSFPCYPAEDDWNSLGRQKGPAQEGFLYVKARKAGSSTVAGVAIRIARNMALRAHLETPVCRVRFNHPMASKLQYSKRDKAKSFLWSILREPTRRFMSEFFHFGVSRNFIQPSDKNIKAYMRDTNPSINNYYLRWLSVDQPFDFDRDHSRIPSVVQRIMDEYNFLGISERLDESLVALQLILNMTTSDMLYLSSKVNGGWDDGVYRDTCYYIVPSFVSPSIKHYFQHSEEWHNFTVGDNLLYRAVNASLDATIVSLGKGAFEKSLKQYRWALQQVDMACRANVTFPCSPSGVRQFTNDCMVWDSGCGIECIDHVSSKLNL